MRGWQTLLVLTLLALLGVLGALFLAAALATREDQALTPAYPDAADLALPAGPMSSDDVRGVRFGMALRGYRMREVDLVLDRLAEELAERDRRLAALEGWEPGAASDGQVGAARPRSGPDHQPDPAGEHAAAGRENGSLPHGRDAGAPAPG